MALQNLLKAPIKARSSITSKPLSKNESPASPFDNLREGYVIIGFDWRFQYLNNAAAQYLRQPKEEIIGCSVTEYDPDIVQTDIYRAMCLCMESRTASTIEHEFKFADGGTNWFECRIQAVPDGILMQMFDRTTYRQAARELEALYNATSYLFKADNLLQLGEQIVEAVVQEFEYADCGLMLADPENKKILRIARTGKYGIRPDVSLTIDGQGLVPLALRTGEPVYAPNVNLNRSYVPSERRTQSEFVIPLRSSKNGVIGALDLQSAQIDAFSERDQRILAAYAERAGSAIENMQFYEAVNQHSIELEERVAERTLELDRSKAHLEAILNSSTDGILSFYMNQGIQQTNTRFNSLFQCSPNDYTGSPLTALIHSADHHLINETVETVRTEQHEKIIEVRACRKDGSFFDAEIGLSYIESDYNQQQGFVCTIRDITTRKQAELALQARMAEDLIFQNYLKELHKITIELMQIDQLDHFYRRAIELGLERFGFERLGLFLYNPNDGTANGTYGTDIYGAVMDEHHLRFLPGEKGVMWRAFQGEERFCFDDKVPLFNNRQTVGTGWNAAAVLWNGTRSEGWLVTDNFVKQSPASKPLLDILSLYAITIGTLMARNQVEGQLRHSEARYRLLAENVSDVVIQVNARGEFLFVSPSSQTLLGYSPEELVGQSAFNFINADDLSQSSAALQMGLQGSIPASFAFRFQHKHNYDIWLEVTGKPIQSERSEEVIGFVASLRDITIRKQAEETMNQALQHEKELGELKTRLVSMTSHEFRTPMAAILSASDLLERYWQRMKEDQIKEKLASIGLQINHLTSIVDDALSLSRIQSGDVAFKAVELDLDSLCQDLLRYHQVQSSSTNRVIYKTCQTPFIINADKKLMRQVIDNLISNAIKYSPADKPVFVTLQSTDELAIIEVQDQGIGIPEKDCKHLFEPFYRATNVGTISGTGLGLAIVKESVELHRGQISVQSEVNVGTTITVKLPLQYQYQ